MDKQLLSGIFAREEDILAATRATRAAGFTIYDVYTPYAVHGLDEAMGLKPSRLTWVCLAFALTGLLGAALVQFWIGSIDWPLNIGGKPFNSLPAYLPIMFELTVLVGGLGVVFVLFVRTNLYPGKAEWLPHHEVTNDRFVLVLETRDSSFDLEVVQDLWQQFNLIKAKILLKEVNRE